MQYTPMVKNYFILFSLAEVILLESHYIRQLLIIKVSFSPLNLQKVT